MATPEQLAALYEKNGQAVPDDLKTPARPSIQDRVFRAAIALANPVHGFINEADHLINGPDAETQDTKLERYGKSVVAELAQTPGTVAGLVGLGEMGARVVMGEDISTAALSDAGRQKVALVENPNISPEIKASIADTFGPEDLNSGLQEMSEWYDWASELTDLKRDIHTGEVPLDEELAGIIGSAFVGLPKAVVARAVGTIAEKAGRTAAGRMAVRIAESRVGRVAIRAGEMSLPGTFPLTPGNIAANVGVQVGINDVMRTLQGEQSLLNISAEALTDDPLTKRQIEQQQLHVKQARIASNQALTDQPTDDIGDTPWAQWAMLGAGALGIGAILSAAAGRPSRGLFSAGGSVRDGSAINRNLSDVRGGNQLEQIFAPGKAETLRVVGQQQTQDATTSVLRATEKATNRQMSDYVDAVLATQTRAGAEQLINIAAFDGKMPMTGITVPRLAEIDSIYRRLDNSKPLNLNLPEGITTQRQLASAYAHALDAQRYRQLADAEIANELPQLSDRIIRARRSRNVVRERELTERYAQLLKLREDPDKIRMSMEQWSRSDLQRIIQAGEQDEKIVAIQKSLQKVLQGLSAHRVKMGETSAEDARIWAARWRGTRIPLQLDPLGNTGVNGGLWGGAKRGAKQITKAVFDKPETKDNTVSINKGRALDIDTIVARSQLDTDVGDTNKVNVPTDPITAVHAEMSRVIRYTMANDARRTVIDTMRASPATRNALRKVSINGRDQFTRNQIASGNGPELKRHYLPIARDGKIEFWEFGDDIIRQGLELSPHASAGFFNYTRRMWQQFTTGALAPWFAPKGLLFDVTAAAVTKQKGDRLGFIDAAIGSMTNGRSGLQGDPTAFFDALYGASKGIYYDAFMKNFGNWFANHLGNSSSLFANMIDMGAKGAGFDGVKAMGEAMLDRFHRSTIGVLHNEAAFGNASTWLQNPADQMIEARSLKFNLATKAYISMLDSIHNGAKIALFSRGYAALQAKYGAGKVPRSAIVKLGHRARSLAGDMSKQGASETLAKVTGALPYSNVTIQSMAQVYGMMARQPVRAMQGLFNGIAVPTAVGFFALSQNEEARDWFFNKVPGWERASTIPVPTFETAVRVANGTYGTEQWQRDDFMLVPIAPELVPLKELFASALGYIGLRNGEVSPGGDLYDAFASVFNIVMPPAASAAVAFGGGGSVNPAGIFDENQSVFRKQQELRTTPYNDKMYVNGVMDRNIAEGLAALFGTAGRIAIEMMESGAHEARVNESATIDEVLGTMFDQGSFEATKRVPIVKDMWGLTTQYSSTPVTESYYQTMRDLSTVFGQFDVEMNTMLGNSDLRTRRFSISELPNRIRYDVDGIPAETIKSLVVDAKMTFDSNPVLEGFTKDMSRIVRERELVRSNRSMKPELRESMLNQLEVERQETARIVAEQFIQPWLNRMEQMLGQEVSARDIADIVERSVMGE